MIRARSLVFFLAVLVSGCAAQSEPRSPSSTPTSAPATMPESESVAQPPPAPPPAGAGSGATTGTTTSTPTATGTTDTGAATPVPIPKPPTANNPTPPTPEPPPVDDVPHAQAKFEESAQVFTSAGGDCAKMCKALASMTRAAEHLCDLVKSSTTPEKKKCSDAKARVEHARDKVLSTCGGCD